MGPVLSQGSLIVEEENLRERCNFGRMITSDVMLLALEKGLRAKEYVWPLQAVGKAEECVIPLEPSEGNAAVPPTPIGLLTARSERF